MRALPIRAWIRALPEDHRVRRALRYAHRRSGEVGVLAPAHVLRCSSAYVRDARAQYRYRQLDETQIVSTRTSDTVFVLGAGKSLDEIEEHEWARFAGHDTLSLSEFFRQSWIAPRYHLIGEIADVEDFARLLSANPLFTETILLVQEGWRAHQPNELLGRGLVREGTSVFRYRRTARGRYAPPSTSFATGVVHGWNSSISATNIALLLGWRRIVLTGIDMYDKEYFWLPPGGRRPHEPQIDVGRTFPNAEHVVDTLGRWRRLLEPQGTRIEVYNPRSLLARELDVFSWEDESS